MPFPTPPPFFFSLFFSFGFFTLFALFFFTFTLEHVWLSVYTTCMFSGRVRCENKAQVCKGLKWNFLIIALCWIVKADIVLPTVGRQLVQSVVQGCHGPLMQQVHSRRWWKLRHFTKHNLFSPHSTLETQAALCAHLGLIVFSNSVTLT